LKKRRNQKHDIIVICDNIRSRENVGSIFRTADGAGVSKIYLCGYTPKPPHHKISKSALGAESYVLWEACQQTWRLIKKLQKEGFFIVALEQARGSENIFRSKLKYPLALVLGNEVKGLSRNIISRSDKIVHVPMLGKKESLNVSVAFGVAVYQLTNK
jgi:tRNA G18 (ribose-2'-O)-methylase SpoU